MFSGFYRLRRCAGALLVCLGLVSCGAGHGALDCLTLEQKIGQMVMLGFEGTQADAAPARLLQEQIAAGELGGVLYFRYNITGPEQARQLTAAFERANPLDLPLLQALDQEGGLVQRLRSDNGFADTPSAEDVAATQTPAQAYQTYRAMAGMVRQAGFTLNLGPVVDLRGAPDDPLQTPVSPVIGQFKRAYSHQPEQVTDYAASFIRAHRDVGVLTALKHYPGHGLSRTDSHHGLTDITDTAMAAERVPFRRLIQDGLADAVMSAHLVNRHDDEHPATLSDNFLQPQLRGIDGFGGVVITDNLFMGAIIKHYTLEESIVRAIRAGNDILVFSNNPSAFKSVTGAAPQYDLGRKTIAIVMAAIARGEISRERIEMSWQRIKALRQRIG